MAELLPIGAADQRRRFPYVKGRRRLLVAVLVLIVHLVRVTVPRLSRASSVTTHLAPGHGQARDRRRHPLVDLEDAAEAAGAMFTPAAGPVIVISPSVLLSSSWLPICVIVFGVLKTVGLNSIVVGPEATLASSISYRKVPGPPSSAVLVTGNVASSRRVKFQKSRAVAGADPPAGIAIPRSSLHRNGSAARNRIVLRITAYLAHGRISDSAPERTNHNRTKVLLASRRQQAATLGLVDRRTAPAIKSFPLRCSRPGIRISHECNSGRLLEGSSSIWFTNRFDTDLEKNDTGVPKSFDRGPFRTRSTQR